MPKIDMTTCSVNLPEGSCSASNPWLGFFREVRRLVAILDEQEQEKRMHTTQQGSLE